MTDLEMTKLCAKAIGYDVALGMTEVDDKGRGIGSFILFVEPNKDAKYDPLHDDAQAMALVKKFMIGSDFFKDAWQAWPHDQTFTVICADLNRSIVECVAKMQAARSS